MVGEEESVDVLGVVEAGGPEEVGRGVVGAEGAHAEALGLVEFFEGREEEALPRAGVAVDAGEPFPGGDVLKGFLLLLGEAGRSWRGFGGEGFFPLYFVCETDNFLLLFDDGKRRIFGGGRACRLVQERDDLLLAPEKLLGLTAVRVF